MDAMKQEAVSLLEELLDEDITKKLRERLTEVINILNQQGQLIVEKALMELEELSSLDLPSYQRTRLWDIISLLESALSSQH